METKKETKNIDLSSLIFIITVISMTLSVFLPIIVKPTLMFHRGVENILRGTAYIFLGLVLYVVTHYTINPAIHEFGHLIFGLIFGFKVYSYSVFGITFINENNKLKVRYIPISGVGGYVEMTMRNENQNYFFPYAGGIIFNAIFGGLSLYLAYRVKSDFLLVLCTSMTCSHLCYLVTNILPLSSSTLLLDGGQIKKCNELKKEGKLNQIIKLHNVYGKLITNSITKIDDKEFLLDSDRNVYTDDLYILYIYKLIQLHKYKDAEKYIKKRLRKGNIEKTTSCTLEPTLLYLSIINGHNKKEINKLFESDNIQVMVEESDRMIAFELYAYYKLIKNDKEKSNYYLEICQSKIDNTYKVYEKELFNEMLNSVNNKIKKEN